MPWNLFFKDLAAKATYLPVIYLLVTAPALLALGGIAALGIVGASQFFSDILFPTDFVLVLAGVAFALSGLMYLLYVSVIKLLIKQPKPTVKPVMTRKLESKLEIALGSVRTQFNEEHAMLLQSIKNLK
ncbi:MAG TPA: hypothetical protein VNJ08_11095 [Bacteriovoracaceae bacterium]|nr:hypothetical protein [Bacteriovoracaceae bacterium]